MEHHKTPLQDEEGASDFNHHLEQQLQSINISDPTFIVGDLNQDLLTSKGDRLKDLMENYSFGIDYNCPTHCHGSSKSQIDVVFCNTANISSSSVIVCPFSNHHFVLTKSSFDSVAHNLSSITARVLNKAGLEAIKKELSLARFETLQLLDDSGDRWHFLKLIILEIIDKFAPLKKFRLKKFDNLPWIDKEAHYYIRKKDLLHHKAVNSKTERDSVFWTEFKAARNMCKSVLRKKMKDYFLDKDCKYFKSSKKFWFFY